MDVPLPIEASFPEMVLSRLHSTSRCCPAAAVHPHRDLGLQEPNLPLSRAGLDASRVEASPSIDLPAIKVMVSVYGYG